MSSPIDWSHQRPFVVSALLPLLSLAQSYNDEGAIFAIKRMADPIKCLRVSTRDQLEYLGEDLVRTSPHADEYLTLLQEGLSAASRDP